MDIASRDRLRQAAVSALGEHPLHHRLIEVEGADNDS
jgi:hypothetical protein